jgi:hypothetical protein
MAHWLKPPLVESPSPADRRTKVRFRVSEEYFEKNVFVRRRTPILQFWCHVIGQPPPINNISRILRGDNRTTICTLFDSVACFKGVKRPLDGEDDGDSIVTYVLNIPVSVEYNPDLVCVASAVIPPQGTCATVQVKPNRSLQPDEAGVYGIITRIEFVFGDGVNPTLPRGHAERYQARLW